MEGRLSDLAAHISREFFRALGSGKTFKDTFDWAVAGAKIDPEVQALHPKF